MSAALDLRSKEEKDAALDKRIEALRKKNEALIRRYQEIEEDRRRAEQEGVAVTAQRRREEPERRGPDRDLSVTLQLLPPPAQEQRLVKDRRSPARPKPGRAAPPRGPLRRPPRGATPPEHCWEGAGGEAATPGERGGRGRRARGRGGPGGEADPDRKSKEWEQRRRQNIERMKEEMEKIAEYERSQRDGLPERNPVRNFLDDPRRCGPAPGGDRREGSRRHGRNWGGADFSGVRAGMERERSWQRPLGRGAGRRGAPLDMTLSMTGRERAEYLRWKQEREQIDRERLARHRQPGGRWRREWDAHKGDPGCKEGSPGAVPEVGSGEEEQQPRGAPKPPTFGEFLTPQRLQRRRKARGHSQAPGTKAYSMHDDRWEEEQQQPPAATHGQEVEEAPSQPLLEPPHSLSPEEDEDQWEDVSEEEEEEEEEEEAEGSPEPCSEDEAPRRLSPVEPLQGLQTPPEPSQGAARRLEGEQEAVEIQEEATGSPAEDSRTREAGSPPGQQEVDPPPGAVEIRDFQRAAPAPRCPPSPGGALPP